MGLFLLGTLIFFLIYLFVSSLTGSALVGSFVNILLGAGFGIATYLKYDYRGEPVYPIELALIQDMDSLLAMIDTSRLIYVYIVIAGLILAFVLILILVRRLRPYQFMANTKKIVRLPILLVSLAMLVHIYFFNSDNNLARSLYDNQADWQVSDQIKNYKTNGYLAGFLYNLPSEAMPVQKDYSKEKIETLYKKYKDRADDINQSRQANLQDTNIIYIMNETFTDPKYLPGLEINKDPIPFFRQISQANSYGQVMGSTIGGGTAKSEFQVLTGISLEPFHPNYTEPYQQFLSNLDDFPSMVNYSKHQNLRVKALHPYLASFYNRTKAYEALGFEEFIDQDKMSHSSKLFEDSPFISDESTYEEIISMLKSTEEKDFIHVVTMQNHQPYLDIYPEIEFELKESTDDDSASGYLQGLSYSDQALAKLVADLDSLNEPYLILFWGDHGPAFYNDLVDDGFDYYDLLKTPVMVYCSQSNQAHDLGLLSPIYLNNEVYKLLNLPVRPYDALLMDLQEQLPVLGKGKYMQADSDQIYTSKDQLSEKSQSLLNDYHTLIYDLTTANNYGQELGFYDLDN